MDLIAGCDESGRGCLAGPVIAACVLLDPGRPIAGLADSKKLTARKREYLAGLIKDNALAWAIAAASVEEIDTLNIFQASMLAMKRAIDSLHVTPHKVLIDGNKVPRQVAIHCEAIVGGDATVPSISAASILAKVERDRIILDYHQQYPQYAFDQHKSYATRVHLAALAQHGPSPIHRKSFAPVAALLEKWDLPG